MHINYKRAQNTKQSIKISTVTVEDFRKLNKFLFLNNIPFHTFALEEERKVKVLIKGIPLEFETDDINDDLDECVVYLESLRRNHTKECLVPHWTKDCDRSKESGGKPSCCNCGKNHTANYGGCPEAPRPKPVKFRNLNRSNIPTNRPVSQNQFPPLSQSNRPTVRAESNHTVERAGGRISRPAPFPDTNKWKNPLPWVKPKAMSEPNVRESPTHPPRRTGAAASALGKDINTIMSILQVVRSAEVADLAAKFRRAKHGVDRLQIILENQDLINKLENL
ncbi:hypothetical protein EVAR_87211_1 [Eumeta japonica]|uniref:Nucleic-acid-binding protein from transposon X-element n=1 Tax=Eumeta variegata TaxID=151549 RepID=A0A4C1VVT1_EUMVA|nr:hypothetical protein EVAR_87211_1 [Eumeta japonica]